MLPPVPSPNPAPPVTPYPLFLPPPPPPPPRHLPLPSPVLLPASLSVCTVGAGGCALPMAIHRHFPKATVDAVDIDAEALDLAQCYFGAEEDAHLLMHNDDGIKFLTRRGVASKVQLASV